MFKIQHLSANFCPCPWWGCVFSLAKSDMTSLVYAAIILLPSLSSPALYSSDSSEARPFLYKFLSSLFLYILLPQIFLFQFLCLKSASVASLVHICALTHLCLSFSPSSHFCMQVAMVVGEAAWQYRKKHKKKDTMNSNLSVEEEEAIALSPCIALIAQQDYI